MKKNKKKIIITLFILLLLLAVLWFFLLLGKEKRDSLVKETQNLFPFGKIETGIFGKGDRQKTTEEGEIQETEEKEIEEREAGPRLRLISNFPTGGFIPLTRIKDKEIIDISINSNGIKSEVNKIIQVKEEFVRYSAIKDSTFYESSVNPYKIKEELLIENYIPNTEQVIFSKNGENVILQYWDTTGGSIATYLSKIEKVELDISGCKYDFTKQIDVGDDGEHVLDIHMFLNENPKTQISATGINSPGNESSLAIQSTITAIKNFQSLNELDIDGKLGAATRKKMVDICDILQLRNAEEEFNELETKYTTSGFFLPQNITSITINPNGDGFFYLEKDSLGVVGIVRNFINNNKKTIFESPYYGWIINWNNEENIELTTKASYKSKGFTYGLNPNTEDYHKSFKEKDGLTTLASIDNTKILVHETAGSTIKNSIYDRDSHSFTSLFIQTFPEKCAWSKNSPNLYCAVPNSLAHGEKYPDKWYQGMESFNDSLWVINSATGEINLISDLTIDFSENIDVSKINIDEDENYLYFIDKKTEFLWSYRLLNV